MQNITLKDLAEKLNVSVSTVSKALNDSDEISEYTKLRVKELAKLYKYTPNKIALSLKSNQTKTIGVIIPDILNPFFAKVLLGIEKEATAQGYQIITCISNESLVKERQSLQLLTDGSVDGVIVSMAEETFLKNEFDHFKNVLNRSIPFVMFDRVTQEINVDKVVIDDSKAIYRATKALLSQGRREIAFFSNISKLNVGELREEGYRKAILEHHEPLILNIEDKRTLNNKIKNFLKTNQIDGVVAADNITGVIAINTATHLGLNVPDDIAVLGFGDEKLACYALPQLTTINQNHESIGFNACDLLINRLQSKSTNYIFVTRTIETSIVERESFITS